MCVLVLVLVQKGPVCPMCLVGCMVPGAHPVPPPVPLLSARLPHTRMRAQYRTCVHSAAAAEPLLPSAHHPRSPRAP